MIDGRSIIVTEMLSVLRPPGDDQMLDSEHNLLRFSGSWLVLPYLYIKPANILIVDLKDPTYVHFNVIGQEYQDQFILSARWRQLT